ncbi:SET domain-containing protein 4 [Epargyreus clarus]|uniref:SET domain-containing protein 4 n=1 Tax=Epargyreus clarus TaxID=520877 RepID=UPI003C2CD75C
MGRTQRKRKHKKISEFRSCDDDNELIKLNSWLAEQGVRRSSKLVLAVFTDTGRGVLTKKKILAGDELINLPLNLTINVTSLLMDSTFCNIFLENSKHCLLEHKESVSFQSLMAFYLVFLKAQGSNSKWHIYLENLPKSYTVPYFLPKELKHYIDTEIASVISKQKDIIESTFNIFLDILNNNVSCSPVVKNLKEYFSISVYEWAYFTVNTRCVYMDLSNILDLQNTKSSILALVNDNTKISLCPYLDMINHSPNARNETKLLISRDIENIAISKLKHDIFSDVRFSICTKNNFDPYTQVFICYGDSHNLKLITEYGFYLPSNDLDFVTFEFEQIKEFLNSNGIKLSHDQLAFVTSHGLDKDLYIDFRGLSFNFYGVLMVVKYFYSQNMDVSRLIYSAALCSNDRVLIDLILPMVRDKLISIKEATNKLENLNCECAILNNCKELMLQYVNILEQFIKC